MLGQGSRDLMGLDIGNMDPVCILIDTLDLPTQVGQDVEHDVDVLNIRNTSEYHRLIGEEGGGDTRQGGVLIPACANFALYGETTINYIDAHESNLPLRPSLGKCLLAGILAGLSGGLKVKLLWGKRIVIQADGTFPDLTAPISQDEAY